uniref:Uncharacterized protein n=1 Tax=Geoglobus ahangari TaxID=113653 RepID=A0A7C4W4E3_9EURY
MLEDKILKLLEDVKYEGILQGEIVKKLRASKSRVSEILKILENQGVIVRNVEVGKSYRVWLARYYPYGDRLRLGILKSTEYSMVISAVDADFIVYENAIDLTRDLIMNRVDVAASPLITQVLFGIMMKNIRIFDVVAENGSGIVFGEGKGLFGTSEMSAMEINLKAVRNEIPIRQIEYYSSPEKMIENLSRLEGIAIWEPYISMIENEKIYFKEIIGDTPCCTIAANEIAIKKKDDKINELLDKLKKCRIDFKKVSNILGFNEKLVRDSVKSYNFNPDYSLDEVVKYLKRGGIDLSRESLVKLFENL